MSLARSESGTSALTAATSAALGPAWPPPALEHAASSNTKAAVRIAVHCRTVRRSRMHGFRPELREPLVDRGEIVGVAVGRSEAGARVAQQSDRGGAIAGPVGDLGEVELDERALRGIEAAA